MAVTIPTRLAGPYLGNGLTVTFSFAFKVFTAADLFVVVDTGFGLSILNLNTDYSVALNANQDVSPGGSITLTTALPVAFRMVITSDIAMLQQIVLTNLGGFYPEVLNTVFDRLTILIQQLQVTLGQCIRLGITDDTGTAQLPAASQRAGKYLGFASDGSVALLSGPPGGGGGVASSSLLLAIPGGNRYAIYIKDGTLTTRSIGPVGTPALVTALIEPISQNRYSLVMSGSTLTTQVTTGIVPAVSQIQLTDVSTGVLFNLTVNSAGAPIATPA